MRWPWEHPVSTEALAENRLQQEVGFLWVVNHHQKQRHHHNQTGHYHWLLLWGGKEEQKTRSFTVAFLIHGQNEAMKHSGKLVIVTVRKSSFFLFEKRCLASQDSCLRIQLNRIQEFKWNILLAVFISTHFIEGNKAPFFQSNKHQINIRINKWYRAILL